MNYPNYGQPPMPGYPAQMPPAAPYPTAPGYPPAYPMPGYQPQQGYGPAAGVPSPPPPPTQQWSGGAAFDAKGDYEKRPGVSFKDAPVGTTRTLVCDQDPIVIHGTDYATGLPAYDSKGNPKWAVGTGFIDETGQKVTHWCGKWSKAAQRYTAARTAVGLGPTDSMIGWATFIRYTGNVKTNTGDARDFDIMLMPMEQATQYLSPAQIQASGALGVTTASRPGTPAAGSAPQAPPAPQAPQPNYPAPMPPAAPSGPWAGGAPVPGTPPAAPGWPSAAPQAPAAPVAQPMPPQGGSAPYGAAPQSFPGALDPMASAVHTVQQTLGGQVVSQGAPTPAPGGDVYGFKIDALAAYATMPDATLAMMGQDVNAVRSAIREAQNRGMLPATQPSGSPNGPAGQPQNPPF